MGMFDGLHDRPMSVSTAANGVVRAARQGCGHELRECLQAALEKAERDYGTGSPAYTILLALVDSL